MAAAKCTYDNSRGVCVSAAAFRNYLIGDLRASIARRASSAAAWCTALPVGTKPTIEALAGVSAVIDSSFEKLMSK